MLLAIDSGLNAGWGLFKRGQLDMPHQLVACGTAHSSTVRVQHGLQNWADRTEATVRNLQVQIQRWINEVVEVAIEYPEFTKGESNKICFSAGRLAGWAGEFASRNAAVLGMRPLGTVQLVSVNAWKGQLPKSKSTERVLKVLEQVYIPNTIQHKLTEHTVDALGVGLHQLGIQIHNTIKEKNRASR